MYIFTKSYSLQLNSFSLLPEFCEAALGLRQPLFAHGFLLVEVGVGVVAVVLGNLVGLAVAGVGLDFGGLVCKEKGHLN